MYRMREVLRGESHIHVEHISYMMKEIVCVYRVSMLGNCTVPGYRNANKKSISVYDTFLYPSYKEYGYVCVCMS